MYESRRLSTHGATKPAIGDSNRRTARPCAVPSSPGQRAPHDTGAGAGAAAAGAGAAAAGAAGAPSPVVTTPGPAASVDRSPRHSTFAAASTATIIAAHQIA